MERSNSNHSSRFQWPVITGAALAIVCLLALTSFWLGQNSRTLALLKHDVEDYFTPAGATVFVGDSLVSSADWSQYLPAHNIVNRGLYGDDTSDLLSVLPRVLALQPAELIVLIGINDLNKQLEWQQSKATLSRIFDRIDAHTAPISVVLVELLPINDSWHREIRADAVVRFNQFLQQQANERQYTFAPVAAALGDGHDGLKPEYTVDGIHLSSRGYEALSRALEPFLFVGNTVSN